MVPFVARFINKERVLKWDLLAILIGFIGMIMVVQPYKIVQESGNGAVSSVLDDIIGSFLALISAFLTAVSICLLRRLSTCDVHFSVTSTYYCMG